MTPPVTLVKALALHDPALRCRWAKASKQWFIERRMPVRHPDFLAELRPPPDNTLAFDRFEAIQAGYLALFTVPAEAIHQTERVMASLRGWDAETQGSFRAINRRLDDAQTEWETAQTKERREFTQTRSEAVADHLMWANGHKIATPSSVEPEDHYEHRDGYSVRVRRVEV